MEKLTKSLPLFKERNCSVSIVLDSRTRRKNAYEFPLSLRFTIDRKFFYFTVGSSFTEKKFSDVCNATKCKSENYKLQKEWKDTIAPKYKKILMNLNKGGILTFEMVRQGEFYQFNLSSCIRQQNSLTAQFVSFSLSNLANIFYPPNFYNN